MSDVWQVSPHLKRSDFACNCGCGFAAVDAEILALVEALCEHFGASPYDVSACRCLSHNGAVGGSTNSYHMRGMAMDFKLQGIPASEVQALLRKWYPDRYGVGRYRNFTHLDVRPGKGDWKG